MQNNVFRKTRFDLSPETHALAKQAELGEWYNVYPVSKRFTTVWTWGIICIIFGGFLNLIGLGRPGVPGVLFFFLVFNIPGLILLIAGCCMAFWLSIYARWQFSLWEYGFIYENKQTRQVFRWDQITSIQTSVVHGRESFHTCKVRRQDGYEVTLNNLPELIDIVLEKSMRQLASRELNIAPPKSMRTFTSFKIDQQGLGNAQEMLAWQDIQELTLQNGTVMLRQKMEEIYDTN